MLLAKRRLSVSEMGVYAIFLVVITVFENTKVALLKNAHIKFMSTNDDVGEKTRIASSSLLVNGSITLVFIALLLLFGPELARLLHTGPKLAVMLRWYIPGLVAMVLFSHLEATQQGHLDFKGGFAGYLVRQVSFFLMVFGQMVSGKPMSLTDVALFLSLSVILGTSPYMRTRGNIYFTGGIMTGVGRKSCSGLAGISSGQGSSRIYF